MSLTFFSTATKVSKETVSMEIWLLSKRIHLNFICKKLIVAISFNIIMAGKELQNRIALSLI